MKVVFTIGLSWVKEVEPKTELPYLSDITPHKYRFLPCGLSAVTTNTLFF
jgi:hypothetical protein